MRVGGIASCAKYRIDEQFENLIIVGILIIFQFFFSIFIFYVVKFLKFVNFPIRKILKIFDLENKRIFKI